VRVRKQTSLLSARIERLFRASEARGKSTWLCNSRFPLPAQSCYIFCVYDIIKILY